MHRFNKAIILHMINRTLLRVKIVQILFSYYKNGNTTPQTAEKELIFSFQKTYDLYFYLLQLAIETTRYSQQRIEMGKNKMRPTAEEQNPNMRFAENAFIAQLEENIQLNKYIQQNKLSWVDFPDVIKDLYTAITQSDFYISYMEQDTCTYDDDKILWRKIFNKIFAESQLLEDTLEEQSIYWINDIDIVISFIIKTIKKFEPTEGAEQALLPMFKDDDDLTFARKLLSVSLAKADDFQAIISEHTKNWEFDRLAYMDTIIMQAAMAEITTFPTIPVNVSINEYMEIAKEFSTEKSAKFINGVLDDIVGKLKKENKLMKAVVLSDKIK